MIIRLFIQVDNEEQVQIPMDGNRTYEVPEEFAPVLRDCALKVTAHARFEAASKAMGDYSKHGRVLVGHAENVTFSTMMNVADEEPSGR